MYYNICNDYEVNSDEIWMLGDWFHTTKHGIFCNRKKLAVKPPPDNLT